MKEDRFERFFKANAPKNGVSSRKLGYAKVMEGLRNDMFLRRNCHFLFDTLGVTYGDDYAEKISLDLISKKLIISNADKFTFNEFPYIDNVMFLDRLSIKGLGIVTSPHAYTFFTLVSDIVCYVLSEARYGKGIFLPDVLIILSAYYKYFRGLKFVSGIRFNKTKGKMLYIQHCIWYLLKALSSIYNEDQNIEIAILDKSAFRRLKKERFYDVKFNRHIYYNAELLYDDYVKFCKLFIKAYKNFTRYKEVKPPKLTYFVGITGNLEGRLYQDIADFIGVNHMHVLFTIRHIYIGKEVNYNEEPYNTILDKWVNLSEGRVTRDDIINFINNWFKEHDSFTARRDIKKFPLYFFSKKNKVDIIDRPYLVYNTKDLDSELVKKVSEVCVDFNKIYNDELSFDELMERVKEAYIDAQAINQARLSIFKHVKVQDMRCHVKFLDVPENYIPHVYNMLAEQTNFIKGVYGIKFTYDVNIKFEQIGV